MNLKHVGNPAVYREYLEYNTLYLSSYPHNRKLPWSITAIRPPTHIPTTTRLQLLTSEATPPLGDWVNELLRIFDLPMDLAPDVWS